MTKEVKKYKQVQEAEAGFKFPNGYFKMALSDLGFGLGVALVIGGKATGGRLKLKHVVDTYLYNMEHKEELTIEE